MPLTADLININNLVLSDTFQTWVNRTNQVIDDLNPLQVYEVEVGATGGMLKETGISAGNYNGVVTLSVNPGPGIGTWTIGGSNRTVVDFARFSTYSLELTGGASAASTSVAGLDEFIVNDISDTQQSASGTVKKVQARNMLPYEIAGEHRFTGNLIVGGNLTVQGSDTFIAANNLRIEDKQIELAYQQAIALGLTGVTGGTFRVSQLGATAYHFTTSSGLTPSLYGHLQGYTGALAGPTGIFTIGSLFQEPFDADDLSGLTGYVSLSSTGNPRYLVVTPGTPFNSFLSNTLLSEGGIVLKGASGDKAFLWYNSDPTYVWDNVWAARTGNIGVISPEYGVYSSIYRPSNAVDDNDIIYFLNNGSYNGNGLAIVMGESPNGVFSSSNITNQILFQKVAASRTLEIRSGTGSVATSSANLYFSSADAGGTGVNWRALSGITATTFFSGLNVDQLDGAHGATQASAYSIPIANEYGAIDDSWTETSAIRRRVTQASHGLTMGDVVRVNSSGNYVKAIASSAQLGEAIGMVSSVSGNSFVVTLKGKISGLSGPQQTIETSVYSAGEVYFLSGASAGKLIADPDNAALTRISAGGVRKPMFLATSQSEGYVLGYVGSIVSEPTDELYLDGLVPIGTIYPYAASSSYITEEWLICDGSRYTRALYPDLYTITYNLYYANVVVSSVGMDGGAISGGIRNIETGDMVTLTYNGQTYTREVIGLDVNTDYIQFNDTFPYAATYEMRVTEDSSGNEIFFIPDLRSKFIRGKGTTENIGLQDGQDTITLSNSNLPSHSHGMDLISTNAQAGSGLGLVQNGSSNDTTTSLTGGSQAFETVPSYVALYYIIRAKHKTKATILTGHDHDNRYIRFDATHDSSSGLTEAGRIRFRSNAGVAGYPLGSSLTAFGPTHDHDLRYVRFDDTQTLTDSQEYRARQNMNSAAAAEGDGYPQSSTSLTHNHDLIYPRFDGLAQNAFDDYPSVKTAFRTKLGVLSTSENDDRYVNVTGDTMTGTLTITGANLVVKNGSATIDTDFYMNGNGSTPFINFNSTTKYAIVSVGNENSSYFLVQSPSIDTSISGRTSKDIIRAFHNRNNAAGDSNTEVYIYGDLTVWADGLTTSSFAGITNPPSQVASFGVDPHASRVFVGGYQLRTDGSRTNPPHIDFYDGDDYNTPSTRGYVAGLTFPTESHRAANKSYVDQQTSFFRYWAVGSGSDGLQDSVGLTAPESNPGSAGKDASSNPVIKNGLSLPFGYWHFTLNYQFTNADNADCDVVFTVNGSSARVHVYGPGENDRTISGTITLVTNITSTFDISAAVSGTDTGMNWTHVEINAMKIGNLYTV